MRPPRRSPLRKKLPPRNNPEIGSEIPRLRSGDFFAGGRVCRGAAGPTGRGRVGGGAPPRPPRAGGGGAAPPPAAGGPAWRRGGGPPPNPPVGGVGGGPPAGPGCAGAACGPPRPLHLPAASPTTHRPPAPARRKPLPCPAVAPPAPPPHLPGPQNRAQPVPAPPEQSRLRLLSPPAAVGLRPLPHPLSAHMSRPMYKSPPTCYNGTNNCYYLRRNRL